MKKMTLAVLMIVTVVSLVLTAVKTRSATTIDKKDCCKASCPQQKPAEDKKGNPGLIFWDTYSSQLLMVRF